MIKIALSGISFAPLWQKQRIETQHSKEKILIPPGPQAEEGKTKGSAMHQHSA